MKKRDYAPLLAELSEAYSQYAPKSAALNEKAKEYLEKARKNYEIDIHDITVVAAYTAMFHAARSLLFINGIKERSHVCIVLYLKSKY